MTAVEQAFQPAGLANEPLLPSKIRPTHLERLAVVYVRQSTGQQVLEHRESAAWCAGGAGGE